MLSMYEFLERAYGPEYHVTLKYMHFVSSFRRSADQQEVAAQLIRQFVHLHDEGNNLVNSEGELEVTQQLRQMESGSHLA